MIIINRCQNRIFSCTIVDLMSKFAALICAGKLQVVQAEKIRTTSERLCCYGRTIITQPPEFPCAAWRVDQRQNM